MLDKLPKIKNHFDQLEKDILEKNEIKIYNNVGKYFYYHFISPKISDENLELYHNSIIYLYSFIHIISTFYKYIMNGQGKSWC